ncbi:MAG: ABC transporter permease, partial [Acidimicrobiales bacterium]
NTHRATPEHIGVVGALPGSLRSDVIATGKGVGTTVKFVSESSTSVAREELKNGAIDFAIVNGNRLVINRAFAASDGSTTAAFVPALAESLGQILALHTAHLSPTQSKILLSAKAVPVTAVIHGKATAAHPVSAASIIGLVLLFTMLSQYNSWILIGVMEEKSSRVVEVLLAAVRPIQLLAGKVLGIGAVAFAQASLVVGFALILAKATGSGFLHGTAPLALASTLLWLFLGFAFYCWVYAAAGSMAERQDQVQSLALPLSIPMIFGYIFSITAASTGSASFFFKVLAYFPPTAPFAMPILVGFGDVSWWQFTISALISIASTYFIARFASNVYRRAILRTGRRVKVREVFSSNSH